MWQLPPWFVNIVPIIFLVAVWYFFLRRAGPTWEQTQKRQVELLEQQVELLRQTNELLKKIVAGR